jgi:hypothetical protein
LLKEFYKSTGGEGALTFEPGAQEPWKGGKKNWLSIERMDVWQGLQFNGGGFLLSIKLVGHGLAGLLPECITDLNTLEEVRIYICRLQGVQQLLTQI